MKQWVILIISLFLVIFFGMYEVRYLSQSSSYILSDVEYCENAIENNNFKIAKEHLEDLENTWQNLDNIWSIFIDHDEIGNIDQELLQFKVYVEEENKEEALLSCRELKRIINHSVEKQKLSVANVF